MTAFKSEASSLNARVERSAIPSHPIPPGQRVLQPIADLSHSADDETELIRRESSGRHECLPNQRGVSVVAEVYPSMWSRSFPRMDRTPDQHDAYSVAAWLRAVDLDGSLPNFFAPGLTPAEKKLAKVEGWILGVR